MNTDSILDIKTGKMPTEAMAAKSTVSANDVVAPPNGNEIYKVLMTIDITNQNRKSEGAGILINPLMITKKRYIIEIRIVVIITSLVLQVYSYIRCV